MDFHYLEQFRMPQAGDIRGAVALYGPPAGSSPPVAAAPPAKPPPVASSVKALAISPPAE